MRGGECWDVGNIIACGRDDPAEVSASCDLSVGYSSGEVPEDWRGGPTTLQEFGWTCINMPVLRFTVEPFL